MDAGSGSRLRSCIVPITFTVVLGMLALLPLILGQGGSAGAAHADIWNPQTHNWKIHFAGGADVDEDICTDSWNGVISDTSLYNMVGSTLLSATNHWDGLDNWRVDMWMHYCSDVNINDVEYEVYAADNPCGTDNISCVFHYGQNGNHFDWEVVYFDVHNVDGGASEYHQTINHEFGHVLGLLDPDYYGDCYWTATIMHTFNTYGCPYREYPYQVDKDSVLNRMNDVH